MKTERKSLQVNLRFGEEEYENLQLLAKAMSDRGKIADNKVGSLLRWLTRSFEVQVACEQQKLVHQIRKEKEDQDYIEFLRTKYSDSQPMVSK